MSGQLPRNRLILGVAALAYGIPMLISGSIGLGQTITSYLQVPMLGHVDFINIGIYSVVPLAALGLLVIGGIMLLRKAIAVVLWLYVVLGLSAPLIQLAYTAFRYSAFSQLSLNGSLVLGLLYIAYFASSLLFPLFVMIYLLRLRGHRPSADASPLPAPPMP